MTKPAIAVFVGSLRKASLSRKMALALEKLGKDELALSIVEIGELPLYNEDLEAAPPAAWIAFRDRVRPADAVLFVTPEYNRSVPGRPEERHRRRLAALWPERLVRQAGAMVSVSPGAIGGFGANHHLRQSLVFLDMPALQQPEAYIGGAATLFDEAGGIADEGTRKFLTGFMAKVRRPGEAPRGEGLGAPPSPRRRPGAGRSTPQLESDSGTGRSGPALRGCAATAGVTDEGGGAVPAKRTSSAGSSNSPASSRRSCRSAAADTRRSSRAPWSWWESSIGVW